MKLELEPLFPRRSVTNANPVGFSHNRTKVAMIRLSILPWQAQSSGVGRRKSKTSVCFLQKHSVEELQIPKRVVGFARAPWMACEGEPRRIEEVGPLYQSRSLLLLLRFVLVGTHVPHHRVQDSAGQCGPRGNMPRKTMRPWRGA
jgi:hypothetical protein